MYVNELKWIKKDPRSSGGVCVGGHTVLSVHMKSRLLQVYFSQLYLPHLFIWRWQHSGSIRKAKGVLDNNFIIFIQIII